MKRAFLPAAAVLLVLQSVGAAHASDAGQSFFDGVEGEWAGPGEIVAGKYKGTKFVCRFTGSSEAETVGMALDGGCRVGLFTQEMSAKITQSGKTFTGSFLDGAKGKGLDVTGGTVEGSKAVFALHRAQLKGAMLARLADRDTMNVTVSVRVSEDLVPIIGMSLKRVDEAAVGSVQAD